MTAAAEADPFAEMSAGTRRAVTFALLGCAFLGMLDGTVVGTAMPRIVADLGGDQTWYVWVVTVYLLTSTVTVPLYGRFSDLRGRRAPLLTGLGIFLAGSVACGAAGSVPALVVFRAVQGIGAGALLTVGMAAVRDLYPPHRATGLLRMQTLLAGMMAAGLIGGPLVGGLLSDHAGWRWAFLLNLPVGLVAGAVVVLGLPRHRPSRAGTGPVDLAGIVLLTTGLSLVLLGLALTGHPVAAQPRAWTDPRVAVALVVGLGLLAVLVPVERRAAVPVLPLRLFTRRTYAAVVAAGFFFQVASLPATILLPLYFQQVRGHTATASGLFLLPLMIGMVVGNRLTAALIIRTGRARAVLLAGAGLVTGGTVLFFLLGTTTAPAVVSCWLALIGLGIGPAMGGATMVAQFSVPGADAGSATAGSALSKQVGGVFGLACAQSLLAQQLAAHGASAEATSRAIGGTVAWIGGAAGLLAVVAVLVMRDIPLLAGVRQPPGSAGQRRQQEQRAVATDSP